MPRAPSKHGKRSKKILRSMTDAPSELPARHATLRASSMVEMCADEQSSAMNSSVGLHCVSPEQNCSMPVASDAAVSNASPGNVFSSLKGVYESTCFSPRTSPRPSPRSSPRSSPSAPTEETDGCSPVHALQRPIFCVVQHINEFDLKAVAYGVVKLTMKIEGVGSLTRMLNLGPMHKHEHCSIYDPENFHFSRKASCFEVLMEALRDSFGPVWTADDNCRGLLCMNVCSGKVRRWPNIASSSSSQNCMDKCRYNEELYKPFMQKNQGEDKEHEQNNAAYVLDSAVLHKTTVDYWPNLGVLDPLRDPMKTIFLNIFPLEQERKDRIFKRFAVPECVFWKNEQMVEDCIELVKSFTDLQREVQYAWKHACHEKSLLIGQRCAWHHGCIESVQQPSLFCTFHMHPEGQINQLAAASPVAFTYTCICQQSQCDIDCECISNFKDE